MTEILWDAALDCVKILPFLFLSYLAVEYTEHRMSQKTRNWIYRAGKAGPVLGGLIGIIPQCGFSAAAAGLFAGGIITPGTLIAVFLSTSDEMLPIMLSEGLPAMMIVKVLAAKAATGIVVGVLVDLVAEHLLGMKREIPETQEMCEHEHCHCSEHGIFRSALNHTAQITVFLFVISVVLGFGMEYLQEHGVAQSFLAVPGLEEAAAALGRHDSELRSIGTDHAALYKWISRQRRTLCRTFMRSRNGASRTVPRKSEPEGESDLDRSALCERCACGDFAWDDAHTVSVSSIIRRRLLRESLMSL